MRNFSAPAVTSILSRTAARHRSALGALRPSPVSYAATHHAATPFLCVPAPPALRCTEPRPPPIDELDAMDAELSVTKTVLAQPSAPFARPDVIATLEREACFLRRRRAALRRKLAEEQRASQRAQRESLDIVRIAERPWAVLDTPIVTNAFKLFIGLEMLEHRQAVEAFQKSVSGSTGDQLVATRPAKGRKTLRNAKSAASSHRMPRTPSAAQLRKRWAQLPWASKKLFVVGARRNQVLKQRMMEALVCGCPDFDGLTREIAAQIATPESLQATLQAPPPPPKAEPSAKGKTAALEAAWREVHELLVSGHNESSDAVVAAKMRLFGLIGKGKTHLQQNH